jgi:nucleotide-binding universal stress UspA family protein
VADSFILVPLDTSAVAERAVPTAAWLAGLYGLPLKLLYVLDEHLESPAGAEAALSVRGYLEGVATRYGVPDASVAVTEGHAASEILAAAAGARFIVIGSHGRGGFRAAVIGSVADKVVRSATVPVLMVPGIERPETPSAGRPVVVALDGSPEAEQALALGRQIAGLAGCPVALVRAFKLPPPPGIQIAAYPVDLREAAREDATEYLARTARPGEEQILAEGDASTVVVETAQRLGAALVVMASTGKGLARRLTLGSTTSRVMHAIRRPLLVVPVAE